MTPSVHEQSFSLRDRDGVALAAWRWSSAAKPRAVMVVVHGMGEHAGRYLVPLTPLIAGGVTVYAYDQCGHGAVAEANGTLGDFGPGGFAGVVADLVALVETARAEHPELPLILLGHSMGSMVAQAFVLDHAALIDGLVLSGSAALASSGSAP